jgi:hypothetical protein
VEKFTIQIKGTLVVEKTIQAENMQDALSKARALTSNDVIKTERGWSESWPEDAEVMGVLR